MHPVWPRLVLLAVIWPGIMATMPFPAPPLNENITLHACMLDNTTTLRFCDTTNFIGFKECVGAL